MDHLYSFCWLIIAQAQTVPVKEAAETADKATEGPGGLFGNMFFFPIMLGVILLYMVMSAKPQGGGKGSVSKSELLANLKKNDQVLTAGGILGTVVNHRSDAEYVTLRVDDSSGARMQVLASSIIRVVSDEDSDKKQD